MSDYHLHLHEHGPAPGPGLGDYPPGLIESFVEHAAARGTDELGFTEHLYRCVEAAEVLGPFWEREPRRDLAEQAEAFVTEDRWLSLERYVDAVVNAKDRGLPVLLGLEVDFFPESIDEVAAFLEPYPWDFLIGSVHWVGGWSIDHGDVAYEFDRRGVERAWEEYFELETELAASGAVDVLAHADVVKKHGFRPAVEPRHLYRAVAEAASASGTAVELNTNGLNMAAAEIYPSPAFLAAFFEAGVPITFGSDAHVPQRVAESFDAAADLARATGYAGRVRFSGRHPVPVSLG